MTRPRSIWPLVAGTVAALAASASRVNAAALLGVPQRVSALAVNESVGVVSENTGLCAGYRPSSHGFSPSNGPAMGSGESSVATQGQLDLSEHLTFGGDYELAAGVFADWSLSELGNDAEANFFSSNAATGLGAQGGVVFAKDGKLYLAGRIAACPPPIFDGEKGGRARKLSSAMLGGPAIPEPSAWVLFGAGALLVAFSRWWPNKARF